MMFVSIELFFENRQSWCLSRLYSIFNKSERQHICCFASKLHSKRCKIVTILTTEGNFKYTMENVKSVSDPLP